MMNDELTFLLKQELPFETNPQNTHCFLLTVKNETNDSRTSFTL